MYSRIKLSARLTMNGAYLKTVPLLTLIIFAVFVFVVSNPIFNMFVGIKQFSFIFLAVSFVLLMMIVSPARLRLETRHFMLARGMKNIRVRTGLSEFGKSLLFYPLVLCLKLFWLFVFEAVPVFSATAFYFYLNENSLSLKAFVVVGAGIIILAAVGFGFYSVFIQRYSKSAFYLACYKDFSPFDAIGESVRKTRDSLVEILLFKLGFLPWFLLCIGIVPMLFVIPYYKQSMILYFINKTRCS